MAASFMATVDAVHGTVLASGNSSSSCLGSSTWSATPLGTVLAIGSPSYGATGTSLWYNFTVRSAGGGLMYYDLNFQVIGPSGGPVPSNGFHLSVVELAGAGVANYDMGAGVWTSGGAVSVSSSHMISLRSALDLSGDEIVVSGAGPFQGAVTVGIP